MPIYEYKCENEHVFDIMQRMSDDPLTQCVECGAPVRKVLHPVGISFKGSGFYSTDYSGSKSANEASPKGETSAKGESSKKTDSSNGDSKNGSSKESKKSDSTSSASSSSPKKD
jgi:putative FmdB family regulatory protein